VAGGPFNPAPFPGGLAPDAGGALVILPPHLYPPRGATVIDKSYSSSAIPPQQTFPITPSDGSDLAVPSGSALRVSALGFGSVDPTATVFASYSLLVNGNPVYGYTAQPVTVGTLDAPASVFLLVPGPAAVTITIANGFLLSSFAYLARLQGWLFQETTR